MQISRQICASSHDHNNSRTGPGPKNKTRQVATSSIEGAINLEMPENKNMQQTKFGRSPNQIQM